jgi:hypothetical protein
LLALRVFFRLGDNRLTLGADKNAYVIFCTEQECVCISSGVSADVKTVIVAIE